MRRTRKDIYFKKIRALHKAMPSDDDERTRFKKETGFTEKEDSRAIGRGLHKSENRHYTVKGYGYKKALQIDRNKSDARSDRADSFAKDPVDCMQGNGLER